MTHRLFVFVCFSLVAFLGLPVLSYAEDAAEQPAFNPIKEAPVSAPDDYMSPDVKEIVDWGKVELDEKNVLGNQVNLDLEFLDSSGEMMRLGDLIDRPTILNLIFYRCRGVCMPQMGALSQVLEKLERVPGKDYKILTISIDPRETLLAANSQKKVYMDYASQEYPEDSWKWMLGDAASIRELSESLGFYFTLDGDQWVHPPGFMILDASGKLTRFVIPSQNYVKPRDYNKGGMSGDSAVFYDTSDEVFRHVIFNQFELRLALEESESGIVKRGLIKALELCMTTTPDNRGMTVNVLSIVAIVSMLIVVIFATYLVITGRRKLRKQEEA